MVWWLRFHVLNAGDPGLIPGAGGRESYGVWDGHIHTTIFKIDN